MEKISWTDCVRNEEVLHRVKEERNILHAVKRRNTKSIGNILPKNCFIQAMIEVTERRGRKRKQPLDYLKETRGSWKLKEKALYRTVWRTGCGRGCGLAVRQIRW